MTREEFTKDYALKILRSFRDCYDINSKLPNAWALDMAISALEQEPCRYWQNGKCNGNTEVCDDAISRHKAIVMITAYEGKSAQIEALEQLPSVQPNRKVIENIIAEVKKMDTLITRSEVLEVIDNCIKGD